MKINLGLLVAQIAGMFFVFSLAIFLAAGTVAWVPGWIFLVAFFGFTIILSFWLLRSNPDLLDERMTGVGKSDQKLWDKVFFGMASVLFYGWLAAMPLDSARFHWSHIPVWLEAVGAVMLLGSFVLFFLVFRENPYLSPAVRIQEDRGQTVVSTGPYQYVRHPMYAAMIPFCAGTSLLLGSWYGMLASLLILALVAWRAVKEETTLRGELPGYLEYMGRVRYRLIPYVW